MTDREKAIKGLECCGETMNCNECPYDSEIGGCFTNLKADALNLLKEQEPKQMWLCNGELCCPQCGALCKSYYHYCNECGQAVKWDG